MFSHLASPEQQLKNCFSFITTWMFSFPHRGIFHLGLVFCRHVGWLHKYEWKIVNCRFIYIRYAAEVIKEGLTLLHLLTLIFITVFCVHITMIYPVRLVKNMDFKIFFLWILFSGIWAMERLIRTPSKACCAPWQISRMLSRTRISKSRSLGSQNFSI